MANSKIDGNYTHSLMGVLNTDGKTVINILANPTTHRLETNNGITGSDFGPKNAPKDGNDVPTLLAVSSVDGVTPVVVYADINGNLLIDSN